MITRYVRHAKRLSDHMHDAQIRRRDRFPKLHGLHPMRDQKGALIEHAELVPEPVWGGVLSLIGLSQQG